MTAKREKDYAKSKSITGKLLLASLFSSFPNDVHLSELSLQRISDSFQFQVEFLLQTDHWKLFPQLTQFQFPNTLKRLYCHRLIEELTTIQITLGHTYLLFT